MDGLREVLKSPVAQGAAATAVVFGVLRFSPSTDPAYYKSLHKPQWTPPNYVFPLMWIPLKLMQSAAVTMAVRRASRPSQLVLALSVFGAHLFLGNYWNVVFFVRRKMRPSLKWMAAFWLSIAGSAAAFFPLSRPAAYLMLPTLAWTSVAAKLNYDIVELNRDKQL